MNVANDRTVRTHNGLLSNLILMGGGGVTGSKGVVPSELTAVTAGYTVE